MTYFRTRRARETWSTGWTYRTLESRNKTSSEKCVGNVSNLENGKLEMTSKWCKMLKNNTYWGTGRTGQAIVTTGTLNKSAHEKLASSSLPGWLYVVKEYQMRKEWHSRQHHWVQDGLSRQVNHEVPVAGTHFQIEQQILVSMSRQKGAVLLTIGPGAPFSPGAPDSPCTEERVAPVTAVQETAFSSHDFSAFFISINTRWTMD